MKWSQIALVWPNGNDYSGSDRGPGLQVMRGTCLGGLLSLEQSELFLSRVMVPESSTLGIQFTGAPILTSEGTFPPAGMICEMTEWAF